MSVDWRLARLFIGGGLEITSSSGHESWSQMTLGEIGGRKARTNNVYKGDIYCMRIYDRVLTQQEMAKNYAVDVERFDI